MKKLNTCFIATSFGVFLLMAWMTNAYSQTETTSFGPIPEQVIGHQHQGGGSQSDAPSAGQNVYSFDANNGGASGFSFFDSSLPGTVLSIVGHPLDPFTNAVEMVNGNPTKLYSINHAGSAFLVDIPGTTVTLLGNIGISNVLGIALDHATGIYYICASNDWLYTINFTTLAATPIGPMGVGGWMIGITCDGSGTLWGYDLVQDMFFSLNKATGAATPIGPIGFDANYGQGLGYDPVVNMVVMCAFNSTTWQAEYRSVNTATGASTFLGIIGTPGAVTQFSSCAIPMSAETPISNWALYFGIGLILVFAIVRFRKMV